MRRSLVVLVPAALALAACGGSSDPAATTAAAPASSTPAPAATAAAPATTAAAPIPRGEWAMADGAETKAVANVGSDGDGATVTRLLLAGAADDSTKAVHYVDGAWQLPVPIGGAPPEGLDWNGSRAVLQSTDGPSRFITFPLDTKTTTPTVIDLSQDGTFTYDALSTDGQMLYLSQSQDAKGAPVEQIRLYDVGRGSLMPDPVVDKAEGEETMAGNPVARVRSTDGRAVYTVYEGPEHPFVHALMTDIAISFGIDLPGAAAPDATGGWTIERSADNGTITAVSERLGKTFILHVSEDVPSLDRVEDTPPA